MKMLYSTAHLKALLSNLEKTTFEKFYLCQILNDLGLKIEKNSSYGDKIVFYADKNLEGASLHFSLDHPLDIDPEFTGKNIYSLFVEKKGLILSCSPSKDGATKTRKKTLIEDVVSFEILFYPSKFSKLKIKSIEPLVSQWPKEAAELPELFIVQILLKTGQLLKYPVRLNSWAKPIVYEKML